MPRRPRLSLPTLLMDAAEGYALWDTHGHMVDHNPCLEKLCGKPDPPDDSANDLQDYIKRKNPDFGITPPASALIGALTETLISLSTNPSNLFQLQCWPVTDSESNLIAILGRIQIANPLSTNTYDDPSRFWGLKLQDELLRRRLAQQPLGLDNLCGFGQDHDQLLRRVNAAIQSKCNLMIIGESGSGRHNLSRLIHSQWQFNSSHRSPLIPLDPKSLPAEILMRDFLLKDSSKTSHSTKKPIPKWRVPANSTILIEDATALEPDFQDLISQAEENVRIISLLTTYSSMDLLKPAFRSKASTIILTLKPLRERIPEIPILAQFMLERIRTETTKRIDGFHPSAIIQLQMFDWPDNWRDLERVIRLAMLSTQGPLIRPEDIPASIQGAYGGAWMQLPKVSPGDRLNDALDQTRRISVEQALKQFPDNKAAAARALGVSRPKLYRLMAELGLE
ncbi:MAG: hypothetical protein DWI24_08960 [Planctomycetota bacterium]|nr:MAG: hypothetical protein DWI24_08960 [Planctomycetota bacterium]